MHRVLWVFLLLALLLNAPRLFLGTDAPVKRTDVADMYVTKFAQGAKFWKNPDDQLWDASILRGAPTHIGSVQPQHLSSILSVFLPAHLSFTIFQILIEFLILAGTYLFFFNFLGFRHLSAIYGSLFHLSMFYWFNENPYVTQTFLSILIIATTSIGRRAVSAPLRFLLLVFSIFISFPPYTVPMAPLVHLLVVWLLSPKEKRGFNTLMWGLFWFIYACFYLPNLFGYLTYWSQSNRSVWAKGVSVLSVQYLWDGIRQMNFWFPCVSVVSLFLFYKIQMARWILLIQGLIIIFISQSGYLSTLPIFSTTSFAWSRLSFYSSVLMLFLIIYLIEHYPIKVTKRTVVGIVLWLLLGFLALKSQWISRSVGFTYVGFGLLSILLVAYNVVQYAKSSTKLLIVCLIFLLPCKLYSVKHYEDIPYGYLYQDPLHYAHEMFPYRVVTLSDECWHPTFYPAQAQIKGQETLDGVSVFYNRMDAKNWIDYVIKDADFCSFKGWNNRVELVRSTWNQNADSILQWLRLNNTLFIRSSAPIVHEGLVLQEQQEVHFKPISKFFSPYLLQTPQHYLYRLKNPITRIFAVDKARIVDAQGHLVENDQVFNSLTKGATNNIEIDDYVPSRIAWRGTYNTEVLLASINFNHRWQLSIDGSLQKEAVRPGPFGMIMLAPKSGMHTYALEYKSVLFQQICYSMMLAIVMLIILVFWLRKKEGAVDERTQ